MASITVYFKPVTYFGGLVQTYEYHQFLVYMDDNSDKFFVRAGPASQQGYSVDTGGSGVGGIGGPLPYGYVYTQSGAYVPGSIDYPPPGATYQSQVLLTGSQTQLGPIWSDLITYSTKVNTQDIPYGFGGPDCNSFISSALMNAGVPLPTDDSLTGSLPSPGSDVPLTIEDRSTMVAQELTTASDAAERNLQVVITQFENTAQDVQGQVQDAIDGVIGAFSAVSSYITGNAATDGVSETANANGTESLSISASATSAIPNSTFTLDSLDDLLTYSFIDPGGGNSVYNYDQTTDDLTSSATNTADGSSQITIYNADGSSTTTFYTGPNGTGSITEVDQENTDGTSQITTYSPDGSTITTNYTGPNGTGTITGVNIDSATASISSQPGDLTYDYNGTGMSGVVVYNDSTNTLETAIFSGGGHTYYGGSLYGINDPFNIDSSLIPTYWGLGDLYTTDNLGLATISNFNGPEAEQYEYTGTPFEFYQNLNAAYTWTLASVTTAVTVSPLSGQIQQLSGVLANPSLTAQGPLQFLTISGPGMVEEAGGATIPVLAINSGGDLLLRGGLLTTSAITIDPSADVSGYGTEVGLIDNAGTIKVSSGTLNLRGAVTGQGTDQVSGASTLEFGSTVGKNQTIDFADLPTGGHSVVDLIDPHGFSGRIAGFASPDKVDLSGDWIFLKFSENSGATLGTLTLQNKTSHADLSLKFVGDYSKSDFDIISGKTTTIEWT
jgi:hypothetical protein